MTPYIFDEFFASGKEESISPFLTRSSRKWGKNLTLKSAILAAVLLAAAFICSFWNPEAANLILIIVYFLAGTPALLGAIEDLQNFQINIDVLMTLAALLSAAIGSQMEGALLLVLFELSGAMEDAVTQKTQSALSSLNQLAPKTATVLDNEGVAFQRSVKEIGIGERLLIKAGEIVPLDGVVMEGSSYLNLVHLTGESQPVPKTVLDEVPSGARNLDGTLTIEVTRTSPDSTISRIMDLITQASESKPKLARLIDRFGKTYATIIILLFFTFAIGLPLIFPDLPYLGTEGGIYRALTFLIAASPCALVIATPTAYLSAISSCARRGIILKGGVTLDAVASCHTVAFDKTGTLTIGKLNCESIKQLEGESLDLDSAIAIAAGLERHAVHPIAEAINQLAASKKLAPAKIEDFKSVPGFGLEGKYLGKPVYIGQSNFIGSKLPPGKQVPAIGMTTLLLFDERIFLFTFTDTIRPDAKALIDRIKNQAGLRTMMLTGDHRHIAEEVAHALGIDELFANLTPEDKLKKVAEYSEHKGLIMVGDGINDAPALARATVGISMGKIGSATAVDASDIIFLHDDIHLIDWLHSKAKKTLRIVKQNLGLALGVIVIASTPALLGYIPLWAAVILHEGGTVLVGLNSLRLLSRK